MNRNVPLKRGKAQLKRSPMARGQSALKRSRLRPEPDPELVAWGNDVRARDGNVCQWLPCGFCRNEPSASNDAHHKALRSARPDLRLVLDNGVTLCRRRHEWIHSDAGREEAIATGFLNMETYEAAMRMI